LEQKLRRAVTSLLETGGDYETFSTFRLHRIVSGDYGIGTEPAGQVGSKRQRGQQPGQNNSNAPVAGRNSFAEGHNPGLLTALLALEAGNVIDMRLRRIAQAAPRQQPKAS
jgi:hypothetical protein